MMDKEKYLAEIIIKHKLHFSKTSEVSKLPIYVSCLFFGSLHSGIKVDDINLIPQWSNTERFKNHKDDCPVLVAEDTLKDEETANV